MAKRIAIVQGVRFDVLSEDRNRFLVSSPLMRTKGGAQARVWISKDHVDHVEQEG
jgi:hypothetical protein